MTYKMNAMVVVSVLAALVSSLSNEVAAFPTEDLVQHVPGLDDEHQPRSQKWFSGYLYYNLPCMNNRRINTHYVYIEREVEEREPFGEDGMTESTVRRRTTSEVDEESPLLFWSNGGPGASSLYGLLTEMGPFVLNDDSLDTDLYNRTGVPSLLKNPHSWNKLASILIFDAPAPVGFSYCDDPSGDGLSCGGWDDESSAWNNYHALLAFYAKFPELKTKSLYLSGESYAGIYIPKFAQKILMHNRGEIPGEQVHDALLTSEDAIGTMTKIPLKGFAVGDACAGKEVNCGTGAAIFHLFFLAGHGQIPLKLIHAVHKSCTMEELHTPGGKLSAKCSGAIKKAKDSAGGYYEYSLYDDCTYNNGLLRRKRPYISNARKEGSIDIGVTGAINDYVCGGGEVLETFVRHPAVMEAFHVPPNSNFFDGDNGVGFAYTPTEPNLLPFYYDVAIGKYAAEGLRTLVYNGDTDPALDSFQAQNWTSHIGLQESQEWTAWTLDNCRRMGGFVTRYEGRFDFLTIRGAGHMVPTNKPEAALTFLKAWIDADDYPLYNPDCEKPTV